MKTLDSPPFERSLGFTLFEIMVVLAVLALILSMTPTLLDNLTAKNQYQAMLDEVMTSARECSNSAKQQQRSLLLASPACPIRQAVLNNIVGDALPVFHADGTTSHRAELIVQPAQNNDKLRERTVLVERLSSKVSLLN